MCSLNWAGRGKPMRELCYRSEKWPLARPFAISSGTYDAVDVLVVEVKSDTAIGRGEASGVFFIGETMESMISEIEHFRPVIESGADRATLRTSMPAGGARNAVDCALWELEARSVGTTVAELTKIASIPLTTVATVSLESPEAMGRRASDLRHYPILKLKLGADDPLACVHAVREARPDARLIADVNGGWSVSELHAHAPGCAALGVEMIEQPCGPNDDLDINQASFQIPLCADESCCTTGDLDRLAGRFSMINIKLDKTGGLTEALALARAARARGFDLMVGNMMGTGLAMAPASLIAPMCRYVDLDGPLLLKRDREPAMPFDGATIFPLVPAIWG